MSTQNKISKAFLSLFCLISVIFGFSTETKAYSILAHECLIDVKWKKDIQPLLLKRFPRSTPEELITAHAYAYGGSIIQDLGYYPYGSKFFSDLMHYVRSGDFIIALIRDSKTLNGYAFALGALSHYASDNIGHPGATNLSVPILYPKLKEKYGDVITYEQDKLAHIKTEFGFDVLQVAQQRFAPQAYHDFIGFEVDQDLMDQAFLETYGLQASDVLSDEKKAIGSYRHAISKTIPKAVKVAWQLKKKDIKKDTPGMTRSKFLYHLSEASYQKDWGRDYQKPTGSEKFYAFLLKLVPKIGPLRTLRFKMPTPETEKLFEKSFNAAADEYHEELVQVKRKRLKLVNNNFDEGIVSPPGEYFLSDDTYAQLLDRLKKQNFCGLTPKIRGVILKFYADPDAPYATKQNQKQWETLQAELQELKYLKRGKPLLPDECFVEKKANYSRAEETQ